MTQATPRTLLLVASLLVSGLAVPSPAGAAASAPPTAEALQNGGLEGAATAANGFELFLAGAATAPVPHGGQQSVNLAVADAAPQSYAALGYVRAYLAQPASLASLVGISYWYEAPNPTRSLSLVDILKVDTNGDGAPDACLFANEGALPASATFAQRAVALDASYQVGDLACDGGATQTLAAYVAANPGATLVSFNLESAVTGSDPWPQGSPLYVDDLSVATGAIRVLPSDLCGATAHASVDEAIGCAPAGGTVLLAPGVYSGFDIARAVTVCAAAPGGAACQDRADVVVDGRNGGLYVVEMHAADARLRGLVVQDANLTATDASSGGPIDPSLVVVYGDRDVVQGVTLRNAGSAPGPLDSRWMTVGINVESGVGVQLLDNSVSGLPSGRGTDGTCLHAPCGVIGVYVASGATNLLADGTSVAMPAATPSSGYVLEGARATIQSSFLKVPPNSTAVPLDAAAVRVFADDANVSGNIVETTGPGTAPVGVVAHGAGLRMFNDNILRFERGVDADLTGDANLTALVFSGVDRPIAVRGGAPTLWQNYVVSGASTALAIDGVASARVGENLLRGTVALALGANVTGAAIDARGNDWGVYSRSAILGKISDAGHGNAIDVHCYIDSIPTRRVCPPTADFTRSGSTWNRPLGFADASTPGGRALASWSWSFGDGGSATGANVSHVFRAPGPENATLTVVDADGWSASATKAFDVTDAAPVLQPIGDRVVGENETLAFRLSATDPDGDNVTYSVTGLPPHAVFDAANATFTWRPNFTQEGNYSGIVFSASDGFLADTEAVAIAVGHRNAPPILATQGSLSGPEGQPLNFLVRATDPDNDPVALYTTVRPPGASFVDFGNGTGQFAWTPTFAQAGDYNLTLQASDGMNLTENTIRLHVVDVDRPPVFDPIPAQQGSEMQPFQVQVSATDPDGDALAYSARDLPAGATFDPAARVLRWTPTFQQAGTYVVTFLVNDGNLTTAANGTITILNVDRAPVLAPIANQTGRAGYALRVALSVSDPDGDPVTFSAPGAPPGVAFQGSTLVWTTTPDEAGNHTFDVVASDGTLTTPRSINVSLAANLPPVVRLTVPATVDIGQVVMLSAYGTTDPDGATSNIKYAWDLNASDGFAPSASGINVTATFHDVGLHVVTVRATDEGGDVVYANATVVVDDRLELQGIVNPSSASGGVAWLSLTDDPFGPVAHSPIHLDFLWVPIPGGPEYTIQTENVTTGNYGGVLFLLPHDAGPLNLPGTHVLRATAQLAGSYLGDTEHAQLDLPYSPATLA